MIMLPLHCVVRSVEEDALDADPPQKGTRPATPTGHMLCQRSQSVIHMDKQIALRAKRGSGQRDVDAASGHRLHSGMSGISWQRAVTSCLALEEETRPGTPGIVHCCTTEFLTLHSELYAMHPLVVLSCSPED